MNNYKCCPGVSNDESEPYFMCENCNVRVHANCLRIAKNKMRLFGDIFFKYLCEDCSSTGEDELIRDKLSWFAVIVLTLYNLDKRSQGLSKSGFFHWKIHICSFIDKHWNYLFGYSVKRKKSWHGTISSILSHFSPTYLLSGTDKLKESGWWKLALPLTPQMILEHYNNSCKEKKKTESQIAHQRKAKELKRLLVQSQTPSYTSSSSASSSTKDSDVSTFDDNSNMEMNSFESSLPWNWALLTDSSDSLSQPQYLTPSNETSLDSFFLEEQEDLDIDIDVDVESSDDALAFHSSDLLDVTGMLNETNVCKPHPKAHYIDGKHEEIVHLNVNDVSTEESDMEEEEYLDLTAIPSLFKARDKNKIEPWMNMEKGRKDVNARCIPMSEYEEIQLLMQLRKIPNMSDAPGSVRRLYRKLCVRKIKRERNIPLFNLDMKNEFCVPSIPNRNEEQKRVLDRFQHSPLRLTSAIAHRNTTFLSRLMGTSKPTSFYSPYTRRLLKPFIRRDTETVPLWLQLMQEMLVKVNKKDPSWKLPPHAPIDYSYVRPDHIPTVNSLAREFFYPGIDLTECLQYPDFSCVVLYKKLIVGFAFMVPDVGYNEAYISFLLTRPEWRKAGIATFMLYHLIQTCMGRDVTLHVSSTNPAVILYQKFGFKVEEFVQNFYDKYFPADSRECRHALFLRLSR